MSALDAAGPLLLLAGVKLPVYTAWCRLGLSLAVPRAGTRGARPRTLAVAFRFGLLRLAVGVTGGLLLVGALGHVAPAQNRLGLSLPGLLVSIAAVRWLEWSLISVLLQRAPAAVFVKGTGARDLLWRAGGLVLSFVTDAVTLLSVGALGYMPC